MGSGTDKGPGYDKLLEHLEDIQAKLSSSSALNGGFDALVEKVDAIKEKQHESTACIKEISDALYKPDKGVFARINNLENQTTHSGKTLEDNTQKLRALSAMEVDSKTVESLRKLAGNDLQHLDKIFKIAGAINKLYWLLAAGVAAAIGKFLWELLVKH